MKQLNCHNNIMTFQEYVDYVHGNYKAKSNQCNKRSWQQEGYTQD